MNNSKDKKTEYDELMRSKEWAAISSAYRKDQSCCMCGSVDNIEAHHVRYEGGRYGALDMNNLRPLCKTCHHVVMLLEADVRSWRSTTALNSNWTYVSPNVIKYRLSSYRYVQFHSADVSGERSWRYMFNLIDCISDELKNSLIRIDKDGTTKPARDILLSSLTVEERESIQRNNIIRRLEG